jgi:uncharacterized membrane protein YkoI
MNSKSIIGSTAAVALLGLGMLAGSVVDANQASAQTIPATATATVAPAQPAPATAPATAPAPGSSTVPVAPAPAQAPAISQADAEKVALAASPGNTIDHTQLANDNGTAFWDVDFTNGGGVKINAQTGAVIAVEAAGTDQGGKHGNGGGGDQAALAAQATVSQADAEKAALAASPGNTIDHSRLGDDNGTVFWDVDFTNGGGVTVNAKTGAVIAVEAAGTDQHGGPHGGPRGGAPGSAPNGRPNGAPNTTPNSTPNS